jgi:hypothetical protein
LKKKPHGFSQEHAKNFNPVNVSAVIFTDNSVILTAMFTGELPK